METWKAKLTKPQMKRLLEIANSPENQPWLRYGGRAPAATDRLVDLGLIKRRGFQMTHDVTRVRYWGDVFVTDAGRKLINTGEVA